MSGEKTLTDLGTKEIHQRHRVMVESGHAPKAKVLDQIILDAMLMDDLIDIPQHQAGEYLLAQALEAGMYTKPLRYQPSVSGGNPGTIVSNNIMRFAKTVRLIEQHSGKMCREVVEQVVVKNKPIPGDQIENLKAGLQVIVLFRLSGGKDPVRRLKKRG
jgi:hypothetical protein